MDFDDSVPIVIGRLLQAKRLIQMMIEMLKDSFMLLLYRHVNIQISIAKYDSIVVKE